MSQTSSVFEADPESIRDLCNKIVFGSDSEDISKYTERVTCGKNLNRGDIIAYCQNCCV